MNTTDILVYNCYSCPFHGSEDKMLMCNHPAVPKDKYKNLYPREQVESNKVWIHCPLVGHNFTQVIKFVKPA